MEIVIINGPNLNLLGRREPEIYGKLSFTDYLKDLIAAFPEVKFTYLQSNHEGSIIDFLQDYGFKNNGIILNPAAYTHTSIAIADAIRSIDAAVVEVHLTIPESRESYRKLNFIRPFCVNSVEGKGLEGYAIAVEFLIKLLSERK